MNFSDMPQPMLSRVYVLGVYLLLRTNPSLPRPDRDLAQEYYGDLDQDGIRKVVMEILVDLESRGIKPYRF